LNKNIIYTASTFCCYRYYFYSTGSRSKNLAGNFL